MVPRLRLKSPSKIETSTSFSCTLKTDSTVADTTEIIGGFEFWFNSNGRCHDDTNKRRLNFFPGFLFHVPTEYGGPSLFPVQRLIVVSQWGMQIWYEALYVFRYIADRIGRATRLPELFLFE